MIIDTHTHLLPTRLAKRIRSYFDTHMSAQLAYEIDPDEVVESHTTDGAVAAWNLPYAHKAGMSSQLNADVALLSDALSTDRFELLPGCTVHPEDNNPGQIIETAVGDHGAVVCKLHCSVGNYAADDRRLDAVYDSAAQLAIPVIVHAGHAVSGRTEGLEIDPIANAARSHPGTTIIVAHLGFPGTARLLEAMALLPNLWADLTPVVDERPELSKLDLERFADRLLFGTDSPNTGFRLLDHANYVRHSSGLTPRAVDMVLGANALQLMKR